MTPSSDKISGENHAEINAIQDVINNHGETEAEMLLKESDMYVTLEPCSSTGKTPPCSATIKKYGIKKVYIASEDNSQNGFAKKEKEIEGEGKQEKENKVQEKDETDSTETVR